MNIAQQHVKEVSCHQNKLILHLPIGMAKILTNYTNVKWPTAFH